jgi:outer membrane cobalamin receptor
MTDTLQVQPGEDLELLLPLSADPIPLEPIVVVAERAPISPKRDYERRHRYGPGYLVTREEIERRQPRFLTEVLHRIPGGMVVSTPPHGYTLLLRGLCRPDVWLDGVKLTGVTSIDQLLSPLDVEAVEVYHGFDLPVEFGVNPCGGVLIWTRMGEASSEPGVSGGGILGSMAKAVVIVLGLVFAFAVR